MKKLKILFTGGGTGGHIFPIIAVTREIRRIYPGNSENLNLFYLGPEDEFSSIFLSQEGITIRKIITGKLRRYFSFKNIIDILFKVPLGIFQSFFILLSIKPDIIFSKGGHGALPVTLTAKILRIPVFLHESDIVPGLANRMASKQAKKIFISFPRTEYFEIADTTLTGNPIRREILEGSVEEAKQIFNLTLKKPVILFLGGSQGAEKINDFVLLALNNLLEKFEIIHQSGTNNQEQVRKESEVIIKEELEEFYHLQSFLDENKLKHAYKAADIIVARAGSGTIFEVSALGKPSILIPLSSSAANHQAKNAYALAEKNACLVIEEDNLTPGFIMGKFNYLFFEQPNELKRIKENALEFSKPEAAKKIAREILEYLIYLE